MADGDGGASHREEGGRGLPMAADGTGEVEWVSPAVIRFSQSTVSGPTYLNAHEMTLADLEQSMRDHGYRSEPIDVVRMPDGQLTSLDTANHRDAAEVRTQRCSDDGDR